MSLNQFGRANQSPESFITPQVYINRIIHLIENSPKMLAVKFILGLCMALIVQADTDKMNVVSASGTN